MDQLRDRGVIASLSFRRRWADPKLTCVELKDQLGGILSATEDRGLERIAVLDMALRLAGTRGPSGPELPETVSAIPVRHPLASSPCEMWGGKISAQLLTAYRDTVAES